jgi:selenocysteine lyase/cysteine desulfurase
LLEAVHPDKLAPSSDEVPGRFEWGTSAFADLAGVSAAVEHLAGLDCNAAGSRRERLLTSLASSEAHEQELFAGLLSALAQLPVTTYGGAARRAATAYFNVGRHSPRAVAEHLASRRVNVWSGDNYAYELTSAIGIRASGGAVRAGLVHYNDRSDVDRLLEALAELV